MKNFNNILVTGAAGFIGFHVCISLLEKGFNVIGVDNINDYYDTNLKFSRLKILGLVGNNKIKYGSIIQGKKYDKRFKFVKLDINDIENLNVIFRSNKISVVCNLAAQAGVRYSLENPHVYVNSNISGFVNILECCKKYNISRLVYASSSSVYGKSDKFPLSEADNVDFPISLYAASKKANELIAYTYSHLFNIETIGLRFFTVYGPWGRPDMALFLFTDAIINNRPINVFNHGNLMRDFTFIDDITEGVIKTILTDSKNKEKYKVYNIGNNNPVQLMDFIEIIEQKLGIKAIKNMLPMQLGDVNKTYADVKKLINDYEYKPSTNINDGVSLFVDWYKKYYNKN